jgi:hypothetical protein
MAADLFDRVNRNDVRMLQIGRGPRFAKKACSQLIGPREILRQHLECDLSIELDVAGEVDHTHPATTKGALDRIAPEQRSLERQQFSVHE